MAERGVVFYKVPPEIWVSYLWTSSLSIAQMRGLQLEQLYRTKYFIRYVEKSNFNLNYHQILNMVISQIHKKDLAALALASRYIYPHANALLYSAVELSFCKCSETYYERLARTLTGSPELARLATSLLIDMKVVCRVKGQTSLEDIKESAKLNWRRQMQGPFGAMLQHFMPQQPSGVTEWNKEAVQTLRTKRAKDIISSLTNIETVTVGLIVYWICNTKLIQCKLTLGYSWKV